MKGRNFDIILYEDSHNYIYENVMNKAISMCNINNWSYYYIIHDKDEDTKKHTHFTIILPSNGSDVTIKTLSELLGIEENDIEKKKAPKQCILYLAHRTTKSADKYQYDWHDIKTNNEAKLREVFSLDEETQYISIIIEYIESSSYIDYIDFSKFILDHSLWSYYRRSGAIINNLIHHHNLNFVNHKKFK